MSLLGATHSIAFTPGQGRDSRIPDGWPSLAGTVLESLAQQCEPGRTIMLGGDLPSYVNNWVDFTKWHPDEGRNVPSDADTWMGVGFWDRKWKRSYLFNDRTPGGSTWTRAGFLSYIASDHRWRHPGFPSELIGAAHVYNRSALDDSRGHFYRRPFPTQINRYSIDSDAWEYIPVADPGVGMSSTYPIAYHEDLDLLLVHDSTVGSRKIWGWREGFSEWEDVATLGHSMYHGVMIYNRTRHDCLFIQGGGLYRAWLMTATGSITEMPPFDVATTNASAWNISYDPVTGNYLCRSGFSLWELNPEAEEWRLQTDWAAAPASADWPGPSYGRPFIPIDDLGVLLWQTYYGAVLYKPASAF